MLFNEITEGIRLVINDLEIKWGSDIYFRYNFSILIIFYILIVIIFPIFGYFIIKKYKKLVKLKYNEYEL